MVGAQDIPKLKPIKEKRLQENISPSVNKKGKWGYANEKGKFLVKAVFDIAEAFNVVHCKPGDTVSLAKVKIDGKWGILKRDGTFLVTPRFDVLDDFRRGIAVFQEEAGHGFVSYTGEILSEQLEELEKFDANGYAWYKKDGKWGVIRIDGTDLFLPVYSVKAEEKLVGSLLKAEVNGKFGVISLVQKRTFLQPVYDSIATDRICNKLVIFKRDGLLGCMDEHGKILSPSKYEQIQSTRRNDYTRILVRKGNLFGLIDQTGKAIIEPCLRTDQFSTPHRVLQYFKRGNSGYEEPYLYYQDKSYSISDFDNYLYQNNKNGRYTIDNDSDLEFPYWMKNHLNEALGDELATARWKRNGAFYPYLDESFRTWRLPIQSRIESEVLPFIIVDKKLFINDSFGIDYSGYNQLETARINVDGKTFPCGRLLKKLFYSVDSKKIQAFDTERRTSLLNHWSGMTFRFTDSNVCNGCLFVVIDIFINNYHMQRILTSVTHTGESSFMIKQDGLLYSRKHGISSEYCQFACINNRLILTSVSFDGDFSTSVYSLAGQQILSLTDVSITHVSCSPEEYYFFGTEESKWKPVVYRYRLADKKAVMINLDNIDFLNTDPWISNGFISLHNHETGLMDAVMPVATGEVPSVKTPVLRYVMSEWDGKKVIALSKNHWNSISEAKWTYIPSDKDFVAKIGDVTVHVYLADENGMARYSARYTSEPEDSARFGYLGLNEPYFTLPVFEDAKDFSDGAVKVKMSNAWISLTKDQLAPFISDSSRANNDNSAIWNRGNESTPLIGGMKEYNPEAIDMGTKVKWASCNLGAVRPEDYGGYYAWGETEPKDNYSWSTYKWCNGSYSALTKYNTLRLYGTIDNKTVLEASDDVASVKLGGKWRVPTDAEWTELREKCTWSWTSNYNGTGVSGIIVTATNGNSIFLPAAGYRYGTNLGSAGSLGPYWSSSLSTDSPNRAWGVNFGSGGVGRYNFGNRYYGHSVRPVSE